MTGMAAMAAIQGQVRTVWRAPYSTEDFLSQSVIAQESEDEPAIQEASWTRWGHACRAVYHCRVRQGLVLGPKKITGQKKEFDVGEEWTFIIRY